MGRTTDTFVSDVTTLTAACVTPLTKLLQASAAFAQERSAYQTLVSRSAARVTELTGDMQWVAGKAPAKFAAQARGMASEALVTSDPLFRQLDQQMQARQAQLGVAMDAVATARAGLKAPHATLKAKVTAFESYIKAKKASTKNPFKKKSVTQAEAVIAHARTFLSTCFAAMQPS